jgi:hypothetical protein
VHEARLGMPEQPSFLPARKGGPPPQPANMTSRAGGRRLAGEDRFEVVVNVSRPVEARPVDGRPRSRREPAHNEARARLKAAVNPAATKSDQRFKIRERVEFGYLQTQAWKSASPLRLLAFYAADFVVVAGSARPSREFAVRPERLEAIELLQSLPGT